MLNIDNGKSSGIGTLAISGLISALSLLVIIKSSIELIHSTEDDSNTVFGLILGFILFVVFISPFFIKEGIIFDLKKKKFLVYTKIYGYKTGKWLSLEMYNSISIIQSRKSGRVGRVTTLGVSEISYNFIIMDQSHQNKKILKTFSSFKNIKSYAEEISRQTEIPLVKYAPKRISKKR